MFGDRLPLAQAYAALLASDAVVRGAIGPREPSRLWSRHLLNCAVVAELVPDGATMVDIGSGAGLPGIPLALALPNSQVVLVDSLQRRIELLHDMVAALSLSEQVRVVRGRAEDRPTHDAVGTAQVVLSRAVAPLDRVVRWSLPFAEPDGIVLALKGATADDELARFRPQLRRSGIASASLEVCGTGTIDPPTRVIRLVREGVSARKGRT